MSPEPVIAAMPTTESGARPHTDLRCVDMPEGPYIFGKLPDGQWEIHTPRGTSWTGPFRDRYEASLAVARGPGGLQGA